MKTGREQVPRLHERKPAELPPPMPGIAEASRARHLGRRHKCLEVTATHRPGSRSLPSHSIRNWTVFACLKAERTRRTISAVVEAATTAQIRFNPVPKIPITRLCRQAIENTAT